MRRRFAIAALIALAQAGCVAATGEPDGSEPATRTRSAALEFPASPLVWRVPGGALELVGRDLNGQNLNGSCLDGRRVEFVRLGDARMDGESATASIDGSELRLIDSRGKHRRADRVTGVSFVARVDDGSALTLRVVGVENDDKPWKDVFRYTVFYDTQDGGKPLCGSDTDGNPVRALALPGRWDYRQGIAGGGSHLDDPGRFTFACEGYVIAKCVRMGYPPWRKALACRKGSGCERTTLAAPHQACTRMLRADYCGDGVSHTSDGVLVNAYDALGIRVDSEPWAIEAEWDQAGARCASASRLPSQPVPSCSGILGGVADCGSLDHFDSGTLLISEVQP